MECGSEAVFCLDTSKLLGSKPKYPEIADFMRSEHLLGPNRSLARPTQEGGFCNRSDRRNKGFICRVSDDFGNVAAILQ